MYYILTIFIALIVVIDSSKFHCTTPDKKPGFCIFDTDCPYTAEIKKDNRGIRKQIQLIKDSYCGQIEDKLKVCCDADEIFTCPNLNEPTLQITCHYRGLIINCNDPMVLQSIVYLTCIPGYELPSLNSLNPIMCTNGTWDGTIPQCVFSCLKQWNCDAHIVIKTHRYPVNKKNVSDLSPIIKIIFDSFPDAAEVKELENFKKETVQAVINFMNSGQTTYWQVYQYPDIIEISQKLQSSKIYNACLKLLKNQTNEKTYVSILSDFSQSNDSLLTNQVIMYIEDNFDKLSTQNQWVNLNASHIFELISSDFLTANNETNVFEGLKKWSQFDWENRRDTFGKLLKFIRLDQLPDSYVLRNINPNCKELAVSYRQFCTTLDSKYKSDKDKEVHTPKRGIQKDNSLAILVVSIESVNANVEAYDPDKNSWFPIASVGLEYVLFSSVIFENQLILFGGVNNEKGFDKVLSIDLNSNANIDLPNMLKKRAISTPIVVDNSIYVFGGVLSNESVQTTLERYDSVSKTWSFKAPLPKSLVGFSVELWHESIYVIGGSNDVTYLKSVYIYNTITDKWTNGVAMEYARVHSGTAIVRGYLYVIGGHNITSATPIVERFNLKTKTWERMADLPSPYQTVNAIAYGFKIIVLSGSEVFEYETTTDEWKKLKPMDNTYFYRNMFLISKNLIDQKM